eukprot:764705-Hanusia_phi.AAC.4
MNRIADSSVVGNIASTSGGMPAEKAHPEVDTKSCEDDTVHVVRIRVMIDKLVEVSLINQTFTVCMIIEASWTDSKMKKFKINKELFETSISEDSDQLSGKLYLKEDKAENEEHKTAFFAPRLVIDNAIDYKSTEIWFRCYDDSPGDPSSDIIVCMRWKLTCTLHEEMELANFPFDNQLLTIRMQSLWPVDCMFRDIKVRIDFPDRLEGNIQDICHRVFSLLRTSIECVQKCVGVVIVNKQQVERDSQSTILSMRIIIPNPDFSKPSPHEEGWNKVIEGEVNEMMLEGYKVHIFDVQSTTTRVKLVKNQSNHYASSLKTTNFIQRAEYEVGTEMIFEETATTGDQSISRQQYSMLLVSISLRRKVTQWMMNVALPLTTCSTVGWAAFAIEPSALADRCSVTLVMLLTMVAYKNMVSSALPAINYLTILDWYILFCFANMILVIIENVVAALFNVEWDAEVPGILTIIAIYLAGVLLFVFRALSVWFQHLKSALSESELLNKRGKKVTQHIIWLAPMDKQKYRMEFTNLTEEELAQKVKKFLDEQDFQGILSSSKDFSVKCYRRNFFYSKVYPDSDKKGKFKPKDDYLFALILLPPSPDDDVMRMAMKKLRKAFSKSSIQGWISEGNASLEPLNAEFRPFVLKNLESSEAGIISVLKPTTRCCVIQSITKGDGESPAGPGSPPGAPGAAPPATDHAGAGRRPGQA